MVPDKQAAPRAPANRAEVVEMVARGRAASKMGLLRDVSGQRLPDDLWRQCVPEVVSVLAAIEAAGVRLVPVEVTEEMRQAGGISPTRYCFLIGASPYAPEGGR